MSSRRPGSEYICGARIHTRRRSGGHQCEGSELRIQFTTDARYQPFSARVVEAIVLGVPVKVAPLEDTTQGKLWAYGDPKRRFSKRKKDELDLIRLAEAWPKLRAIYPKELLEQIDRG